MSSARQTHWEGCWKDHHECAKSRITLDAQEKAALKAELASVKSHAEAMWVQCMNSDRLSAKEIAHSYRAAFPKEPSNG